MTGIAFVAFASSLCFVQISGSALNSYKINEEFGSPAEKQDTLMRVRNKRDAKRSFLFIDNRSNRTVELCWLEKHKKLDEKEYFTTLAPDRNIEVNTYDVHQWLAVDQSTKKLLLIDNKTLYTPQGNTPSTRAILIISRPGQKEVKIGEKFIETLVVVDKSVIARHGTSEDVTRYVMTLLNLGSQILQHPSLGVKMTYVLSKIVLLHENKSEIKMNPADGPASLRSVCNYMNKIGNNGSIKFDHKLFLTRKSFGSGGYGTFFGMCNQYRSCSLIYDHGFSSVFLIAHETGHALGMDDKDFRDHRSGFIMGRVVGSRFNKFAWSRFSKISLLKNIRDNRCLDNKPSSQLKDLPFLHKYPGVHFSLDQQCFLEYEAGYTSWPPSKDQCKELKCRMPEPYRIFYKTFNSPALDGTECDTNKWCISGVCQVRNESIAEPVAIDGNWSEWRAWKPCSKTCSVGIRTRERQCNNPTPRYGGKFCVGRSTEVGVCNIKNCPNKIPEEVEQCGKLETKLGDKRKWGFYDETKVDLNCTFESDLCHWKNEIVNDQQDWQLNRGGTKSHNTGPSADHTKKTNLGQYIYFESSSAQSRKGYKARLSSPDLAVRQGCLSFWYHMFGNQEMGALKVIKSSQGASLTLWTKKGNQGKAWLLERLEIKDDELYQISFVAEKVFKGYRSDIALDDITFTPGTCDKPGLLEARDLGDRCSLTCTTIDDKIPKRILLNIPAADGVSCYDNGSRDICYQGRCRNVGCDGIVDSRKKYDNCSVCGGDGNSCKSQSSVILQGKKEVNKHAIDCAHIDILDCNFDKDFCKWKNMKIDVNDLNWMRNKEKLGSQAHYAYVETPRKQSQKKYKARIVSPEVTASKACLSFLYRMNGANDAKLRVKLLTKSGYVRGFKWTKKGQYGDRWLKARMDVKTKLPYKVVIQATIYNSLQGDIAIDNIQFQRQNCIS